MEKQDANIPVPYVHDTATARSVRTFIQTLLGMVVGLAVTVWAVPGVPHAVTGYLMAHWVELALSVGLPSGIISLVQNLLRSDVKNI